MRLLMCRGVGALVALLAALLLAAPPVQAVTFGFSNITHNGSPDISAQLSVDVTGDGKGVRFTFHNVGDFKSAVTAVFFDDTLDLFKKISKISDSYGVEFDESGKKNFPGGNPLGFSTDFSAKADSPSPKNGINNYAWEKLAIVLSLEKGTSFDEVVDALIGGSLRIGLHVQSIGYREGSDSYLLAETPLPGALVLFLSGLAGIGGLRWLKRHVRQWPEAIKCKQADVVISAQEKSLRFAMTLRGLIGVGLIWLGGTGTAFAEPLGGRNPPIGEGALLAGLVIATAIVAVYFRRKE